MSREIEYRVWDKQDKQYRRIAAMTCGGKYVFLYPGEGCRLTPEDERCGMCGGAGFKMTDSMDRDRLVFEQYTGLKDKNDKKIYEGDIVKYKLYADSRYIDEVFYSTISGAFMVGYEDNFRTLDCLIDVEVIGNVHENKKLLKLLRDKG